MKFLPQGFAAAVGSAAVLILAAGFTPVHAQETPQPPAAAEVDDATLKAFAEASLAVEDVVTTWVPRIEEAEGTPEAVELRQTANQEIVTAVQTSGLEVDTYNQVAQLAQTDPEVATAIQRYRQEIQ